MPGRVAGVLDRALFAPDSFPADLVLAGALAAPILAGLFFFRLPALILLVLALGIGGTFHLLARVFRLKLVASPVLAALVGVGLCGPLGGPAWPALIAIGASIFEVLRSRFWPLARFNPGLLVYAAVFFASRGAVAAYQRPGDARIFPEPIAQWSQFYGGSARFIEPITLYVGNVAGPVFATSLLGVVVGIAWLWYARRLSLPTAATFLVAGIAMTLALGWDPVFHLDSGPAWFVVAFVLCDRRLLPAHPLAGPVIALATAVIGLGLRAAHLYIEALFITVAVIQLTFAITDQLARWAGGRIGVSRSRPQLAGTESVSA